MRYLLVFAIVHCLTINSNAQFDDAKVPEIGKKFESFNIHDPKNDAFFNDTLKMFKGKYLIFDFFSSGCSSCFRSFPAIKQLQEKFQDKLQFVLVAHEDKHIRKQFEVYQNKLKLDMPVVYDSIFTNFVVPIGFPHLIWIDTSGVVRAITSKGEMTEANIEKFIKNESFDFFDRSHYATIEMSPLYNSSYYSFDWYLALDENKRKVPRIDLDTNTIYKSELGIWKPGMTMNPPEIVRYGPNANRAIIGMGSVANLLSYAYVGKVRWNVPDQLYPIDSNDIYFEIFPKPEVESEDSLDIYGSLERLNSMYWYRLIMDTPNNTDDKLRSQMRSDLKRILGYDAKLTRKKVKCYCLIATQNAKKLLQTKGGKSQVVIEKGSIRVSNMPLSSFSNILLRNYLGKYNEGKFYYDETNIDMNVDVYISGVLYEDEEVRKLLQNYGLDIIECEREMEVLKIYKGD
jgi:Thiol-disulfide isomerase and thioredoxins